MYSSDELDIEEYEEEEEEPIEETQGTFTVERAAEIIKHLPPEVPRSSAVRIVRQTLVAAGINIEDLATSTRARDSKLNSEIELRQKRIKELQEKTDNVVRDLEGQIRRAREARDTGISNEERRITAAREGLEDVAHVRDFFGLPRGDSEYEPSAQDEPPSEASDDTQIIERVEEDKTQGEDDTRVIRGPLSERWDSEERDR
ncbi:MAG: hypothetical protein ACRDSJ_21635 [Rubrobacteraceae bacterium]